MPPAPAPELLMPSQPPSGPWPARGAEACLGGSRFGGGFSEGPRPGGNDMPGARLRGLGARELPLPTALLPGGSVYCPCGSSRAMALGGWVGGPDGISSGVGLGIVVGGIEGCCADWGACEAAGAGAGAGAGVGAGVGLVLLEAAATEAYEMGAGAAGGGVLFFPLSMSRKAAEGKRDERERGCERKRGCESAVGLTAGGVLGRYLASWRQQQARGRRQRHLRRPGLRRR